MPARMIFANESGWKAIPPLVLQWAAEEIKYGYEFESLLEGGEGEESCYVLSKVLDYGCRPIRRVRIWFRSIDGTIHVGCKQLPEFPGNCDRCGRLGVNLRLVFPDHVASCEDCVREEDKFVGQPGAPLDDHSWGWEFCSGYSGFSGRSGKGFVWTGSGYSGYKVQT